MTYRPRRIFAYSSGVLSWLRVVALLSVVFMSSIVAPTPRACLHVWTRGLVGWLVGWLVPARFGVCLAASAWGERSAWWLPRGLARAWVVSRVSRLHEVCGWVGDMEVIALL